MCGEGNAVLRIPQDIARLGRQVAREAVGRQDRHVMVGRLELAFVEAGRAVVGERIGRGVERMAAEGAGGTEQKHGGHGVRRAGARLACWRVEYFVIWAAPTLCAFGAFSNVQRSS